MGFIRAIEAIARVPKEQKREIRISAIVVLCLGMIPFIGIILSVLFKCNLCTDYLMETSTYLRQSAYFYQQQQSTQLLKRPTFDGAMTPVSLFMSRPESVMLSPFSAHHQAMSSSASIVAVPLSAANVHAVDTVNTSSVAAIEAIPMSKVQRKPSSIKSTKRKETNATLVEPIKEEEEEVVIFVKEPESTKHHSVFNRVSKQDWMEEVMALSPTDNYRTSFSANLFTHNSQAPTQYNSLRELASRNSRITPHSSVKELPTYLMPGNNNNIVDKNVVKAALNSKRMTQSLHLDNSAFSKQESRGFNILERPDYSHLETNTAAGGGVTRASSMVETGSRDLI
ncbi:hypothetical protein GGF40_001975 [Coemansia sp. RSA 1286]|nr:hypothetical protein IWW45_003722 [Coemansia sp. RSA 485]KAJ2637984.1 hypothetical protein GGF40_001975 [Coemansia sp. RSA 1286]